MNKIDLAIVNEFNKLQDNFWDFNDYNTEELSHNLHNYPAVMIYPISRTIIDIVNKHKKINTLLDPFLGSGTVLLEAMRADIPLSYGTDLNPLATLISKAKTTLLNTNDIELLNNFKLRVLNSLKNELSNINSFDNYIKLNYDITSNDGWANDAANIIKSYFNDHFNLDLLPKFKRLGFWFTPKSVLVLLIIKSEIVKLDAESNYIHIIKSTFSEITRFISNTRNSEFKLYRVKKEKLINHDIDYISTFEEIMNKNIDKILIASQSLSKNSSIDISRVDSRLLNHIPDNSIDIVITSPPYGDSGTTVAYGQFSRLSNEWLDVSDGISVDSHLLGGKKQKNIHLDQLNSKTLKSKLETIEKIDKKRAFEVLNFYIDLDKAISKISQKTNKNGYQFWVVGNRTVKNTVLPTDRIIIELSKNHGLNLIGCYYRNISNKVMPSQNSPTNKTGIKVDTMTKETILFLKKG